MVLFLPKSEKGDQGVKVEGKPVTIPHLSRHHDGIHSLEGCQQKDLASGVIGPQSNGTSCGVGAQQRLQRLIVTAVLSWQLDDVSGYVATQTNFLPS